MPINQNDSISKGGVMKNGLLCRVDSLHCDPFEKFGESKCHCFLHVLWDTADQDVPKWMREYLKMICF